MSKGYPEEVLSKGPGNLHRLRDGSLVVLARYNKRYSRGARVPQSRGDDQRTETERDRGRLAYSSALRRLAGVTQVVSPELTAARMHSRESHTHKVALVARELAQHVVRLAEQGHPGAISAIEKSGGLDITACEAAGLAHDLGHAPFGHAGERSLHRAMSEKAGKQTRLPDGFEGNPQSFRIVTRLAGGTTSRQAMELTNVTLCAILKYPWLHRDARIKPGAESDVSKPRKFGAYETDSAAFGLARAGVMGRGWRKDRRQSLEAAIMDLADDIAYAAHDLEDFVSAEMIDLHDVDRELKDVLDSFTDGIPTAEGITARNPFVAAALKIAGHSQFNADAYYSAVGAIRKMTSEVLNRSNDQSLNTVLRAALSDRIGVYFAELEVDTKVAADEPFVRLTSKHWHEIQVLKTIPRHWLIASPRMGVIQRAQTETVKSLVNAVIDWLSQPGVETAALPEGLRQALTAAEVNLAKPLGELDHTHFRAIADYICGMSDSEALLRSNWFTGREIPGMTMVVEAI